MIEESDRELWPRIQGGDTAAFAELFDRYARDVYNFVFRRMASWDLAEELTSAVFMEAWRRRTEVEVEHISLRPWLFGVALNLLRNRSRSVQRRGAAEARLQPETAPDFAEDLASRIDDERLMRRTLEVFEDLSADEQDVLGLAAWEGLSYIEIAVALGVPIGTVRSRIHRARRHLTELLLPTGHEPGEAEPVASHRSRRDTR
jgi:RNA polymerase sigma factor (sigma-70 family)